MVPLPVAQSDSPATAIEPARKGSQAKGSSDHARVRPLPAVFDIFMFMDEWDLLLLRLHELDEVPELVGARAHSHTFESTSRLAVLRVCVPVPLNLGTVHYCLRPGQVDTDPEPDLLQPEP